MTQACIFLPVAACTQLDAELEVLLWQGGTGRRLPFARALEEVLSPWRLILPVEAVTCCAVRLPTQKGRWLRQALPFAVEEMLAEEVESFHLGLGGALVDGRHRVFAVRRSWLAGWLDLAGKLGTMPASIQIDADMLPEQGTQLLWLDQRWLLGGEGSARLGFLEQDWPHLRDVCPAPRNGRAPVERQSLEGVDDWRDEMDAYGWLAEQKGSDLAQGEFTLKEERKRWSRWKPLLGLVGLWLVLQWGFNLVQAWQLQRQGDTYADANEALYRELFPQDTKLVNLRAQFDQHLVEGSGAGQSRLLALLGKAAEALIAEGAQVRVQQLDFSEIRGDLALQVQAPGFDALERLRERLIGSGLSVQMGSASRDQSGVSARLVIGG
ncbi:MULTISPECIES: type II secretion system protein GspL [unclassified Pseudomonas]|uniref:type II secretion system protein GspL n=1 Tax=unclassified Pseudomonas TaxID=196821 RepID=UPI000EA97F47|nr:MULTISPECIES: type II secretion system protein GspL [unclassified Pseudomonas]AYF87415.1 type II secretion system protein GspL [Pseudomonas sp. DY-1]MDH4656683.1 type II secretion system protein GspL [Pseudomonas sp. BN606]MRK23081.1 type II secretion system protein GspL [Pseudomonas sp. JG-B]